MSDLFDTLASALSDRYATDRFLQEIELTAKLQHPQILPLYEAGEVEGFLYYVMPYVAGESLREQLDREGKLSLDEAVSITNDIAAWVMVRRRLRRTPSI